MSRKLIAAAIFSLIAAAHSFEASAAPRPISHRSPIQDECLKENPQDHQGYLACIQRKKLEQKNSALKTDTGKQPETQAESVNPAAGKNQ